MLSFCVNLPWQEVQQLQSLAFCLCLGKMKGIHQVQSTQMAHIMLWLIFHHLPSCSAWQRPVTYFAHRPTAFTDGLAVIKSTFVQLAIALCQNPNPNQHYISHRADHLFSSIHLRNTCKQTHTMSLAWITVDHNRKMCQWWLDQTRPRRDDAVIPQQCEQYIWLRSLLAMK